MESLDLNTQSDFAFDGLNFNNTFPSPAFAKDSNHNLAENILKHVLQFRRSHSLRSACDQTCTTCQSPHFSKILTALRAKKAITFVLPAFPGKSPNLTKVLGPLPDMAERIALQFLQRICDQLKEIYSPGAQVVLCSDGRIFSDVVGMQEIDVTNYQNELEKMIRELGLKNLSTFNLDVLGTGCDFHQMRNELMDNFGSTPALLRERILRGSKGLGPLEDQEIHRMYCGIVRFLAEDAMFPGQTKSRTAIQNESKAKAYDVILRSNAWSELIAERFPEAIRLSIHPQTCGSKKLGIRLVGIESWMTPWHGTAVKTDHGYVLLKRAEAERLGAQLVFSENGRPSHFELTSSQTEVLK